MPRTYAGSFYFKQEFEFRLFLEAPRKRIDRKIDRLHFAKLRISFKRARQCYFFGYEKA